MGRKLTERALLVEMARTVGPKGTTSLLGVAFAASMLGVEDHHGFVTMPFGSEPSRYRWLHQFEKLRAHLVAEGYDVSEAPDDLPVAVIMVAVKG